MTKQEAINFLSNTKVYVKDKSREIQEKLFEIGFAWNIVPNQDVKNIDEPFIFIYDNRQLTYSTDVKWFCNHPNKEITLEDILNITIDEPKYRPFKDAAECWQEMLKHQPLSWIKRKDEDDWQALANVDNEKDYQLIFDMFTFADGTPFGIKEE